MNDADQQAILDAARDAQVQMMVHSNDISKLPLWFGVPAKQWAMVGTKTKKPN